MEWAGGGAFLFGNQGKEQNLHPVPPLRPIKFNTGYKFSNCVQKPPGKPVADKQDIHCVNK